MPSVLHISTKDPSNLSNSRIALILSTIVH